MTEPTAGGTNAGTEEEAKNSQNSTDGAGRMPRVEAAMPSGLVKAIDDQVEAGNYASRSAAVRSAVRNQFLRGGA